ncbi:hypothetical protein OG216_03515 [Streptomycetaceae bacterium NBC_01309]
MRFSADGSAPLGRMVLVDALQDDEGRVWTLDTPTFLRAHDRLRMTDELVVERPNGEQIRLAGGFGWVCHGRGRPPR